MTNARPEPGWYRADGDPSDTHRYWDGITWVGEAQPLPPGSRTGLDQHLASPWQRILARFIDVAVLIGATVLVRALVDDDLGTTQPSATAAIVALLVTVTYEVGMVARLGATVGKLLMGLRIVDEHGTSPPNAVVSIKRWAPNILALVPVVGIVAALAVLVASLIWIFTDTERRSIFDKAAKTRVVTVGGGHSLTRTHSAR
jgi:uncharacterized RDD family membrane protein YckC